MLWRGPVPAGPLPREVNMKIVSVSNGGQAEVDDEFGAVLIANGQWVSADEPIKKTRTRRPQVPKED